MNKILILGAFALVVTVTGCKSIEVDRRGQSLSFDKNGEVVKTAAGDPLVLDQGWEVSYFQHWNTQAFDALEAKAGEASLSINNYKSTADTNLVHLVTGSITGLGELCTKVASAYATVTSGGSSDAIISAAKALYTKFTSSGGDATSATVSASGDTVTITDGTVTCTDGSCSTTVAACADGSCSLQ